MITVEQYGLIRTGIRVYGHNISQMSRLTGHSRNTIKKALRGEAWGYKERSHQPFPILEGYLRVIDEWLILDKDSPKKQRHTARRIYNRLVKERGYTGSESAVRRYVGYAKLKFGVDAPRAFIPCDPEAGVEAEVDWGSATVIIGGERQRLPFFCMRSKYSGKYFVRFYCCERQQAFFDAHMQAFAFFGGVFPVLIYDNLPTAVKKVLCGRSRLEQEEFSKFRAYYNFEARFCNRNSGHEKGGVEGLVGYARRNHMVPIPQAATLEDLNDQILKECLAYESHKISGRDRSTDDLHQEEKSHLICLPEIAFSNIESFSVKVDKYCTVIVDKNRYSVPVCYAGLQARAICQADKVEIFVGSKRVAIHKRAYGNNKWMLELDHYLELLKRRPMAFNSARAVRQERKNWSTSLQALLERFCQSQGQTKGIKDFIEVLMLYRDYPSAEIEASIELAIEKNINHSAGLRHILAYTAEQIPQCQPLACWSALPAVDISVYGQLGGVR